MALQVKKRYLLPRKRSAHDTLPQRIQRRDQRRQSMRRGITVALVLLTISVIGGVTYTWYMGQQKTALISQAQSNRGSRAIFRPPKVASDAKIGVAVQMSASQTKPGENASITVRTNPEADCSISVKYNNMLAKDSGLAPKAADEFGVATWAWTVASNTPTGKWPVEVLCKNKVHSAVVSSEIEIIQ